MKRLVSIFLAATFLSLAFAAGHLWAGESREVYEYTFTPKWAEHKTFFIDTSPSPTKKTVTVALTVEDLSTGGKQCSGNLDVKYVVDEGEPYTASFTITKCVTHRIVTEGRVRYINFRFINDGDQPAKARFSFAFSWQEK